MTWVAVAVAAVSAVSSIAAGQAESANLKLQSQQAELNSRAETLEGKRQALAIENQLAQDLASQNALFGARNVLQGEGSAQAAADAAKENASDDISNALFNADMGSLNATQRAANLKADASSAKTQGYLKAAEAVAGGYSSYKSAPSTTSSSSKVPKPGRKPSLLSGLS